MEFLKNLCNDLSLKNHVIFYGWKSQTDIQMLMQGIKTLISTSQIGGMELVRAEAIASGCTVVTTETCGTHYFLTNTDVGFLVAEPTIDEISKKMFSSLNDKFWNIELINSRKLLANQFNVEVIAKKILYL